jgi:CheY-like chemotaxis protein
VRLVVCDTGRGIPQDQRDDVFREFVRLDHAGAQPKRGLGLGLAIVARLVDVLGTRVELQSTVARGSMFWFELPCGTANAVPAAAVKPVVPADLRGTFVCVIDDDESARTAMCSLLERWGCLTLAAASGDQALAQLGAHDRPPELIVCDYRLAAGEDGLALIARLHAAIGEPVPAVLVTADTTPEAAAAARVAHVPLLHKPTSPIKLRALMTRLLGRAGERDRAVDQPPPGQPQPSS